MTRVEVLDEARDRAGLPVRQPLVAAPPDTNPEIGDLWRILWHRRRLVAAVAAAIACAVALYAVLAPPLYTATSQVLVDPRDRQVVTNGVTPSGLAPDGGITIVESQARVIESTGVLARAVAATDLVHDPEFGATTLGVFGRLKALLGGLFGNAPAMTSEEALAQTIRNLDKRLAVKRADKVFVIDIVVSARTPERAARLANAVAEAYLADQADARSDAARRASDSLSARLGELRQRVAQAEENVTRYRAEHDIVGASGRLVDEQQLSDVNAQIATASARVAEAKARIDQIDAMRRSLGSADSTAEAINSPVVSKLRQQYAELAAREADLRTQFGERHPSLIAIEAQLRNLRELIAAEIERIGRAARADLDRARDNLRAVSTNVDRLKKTTLSTDEASIHLRELEREVEANRAVYAAFLNRAQETREQTSIDVTNARIITEASPPRDKSWPPTLYLLAAAIVAGLAVGCGTALVREYLAPTVLSPALARVLCNGAPVLGAWSQEDAEGVAAAFDRMLELGPSTARARILLLAGDVESGNSFEAAAEALARLAAQDRDVLVLDIMAKPDGPAALRPGDRLEGLMTKDADSELFRLAVTPAALGTSRQARLATLKRLLFDARSCFDIVFIRTALVPPETRVGIAAPLVDAIVLCVRPGATRQRDLAEASAAAARLGVAVSGVLMVGS